MNHFRAALFALLSAALFAGSGCTEMRIRSNPDAFARATPAQQANITAEVVDIGFDREMVRMAAGEPDRISILTDSKGTTEVWLYTANVKTATPPPAPSGASQDAHRQHRHSHRLIVTFDESGTVVSLSHGG